MYYVYILRLDKGHLYKGFTGNLKKRIAAHRAGKVKATLRYVRRELIHYEVYLLKSDALRRERFLKTTEGRRLLRQQIRDVIVDDFFK